MPRLIDGQRTWSMTRDVDGNREYKIKFLVACDPADGPQIALSCAGLPLEGDTWNFDNDLDPWATCKLNSTVTPVLSNEPNSYFEVEKVFSSKADEKKCKDKQIDDPLLQDPKISGSFAKYQEEYAYNRLGYPNPASISQVAIENSAHEQFKGPQVEFDRTRPSVKIEQNVSSLQLNLVCGMIDTVNNATLWGCPPRCVKLSAFSWERKFYGHCYVYYTQTLEFDIRMDTFDRDLLDEGTKVLSGHWDANTERWRIDYIGKPPTQLVPDPANIQHFIIAKGRNKENMRMVLNGNGYPASVDTVFPNNFVIAALPPGKIHVEVYDESNFLLLGIPTSF